MTQTSISGEAVVPGSVGLAVRAMLFGALLGTGLIALALWLSRLLVPGGPSAAVTSGPVFALVVGGTFAGIGMAIGVAWSLMRAIPSLFRRGGLAILSGFLAIIAMLPTRPINDLLGTAGLLGFALLCLLGCLFLSRKVAAGFRAR